MENMTMKQIAQQAVSVSDLMVGREKLTTADVLGVELTVLAFDMAQVNEKNETKTYPVLIFEEKPGCYYAGGAVLKKLCEAWASYFDGDCEQASMAIESEGGVKIRLSNSRSKSSGNNFVNVEII